MSESPEEFKGATLIHFALNWRLTDAQVAELSDALRYYEELVAEGVTIQANGYALAPTQAGKPTSAKSPEGWGVGDKADAKAYATTWLGGGPLLRETEPRLLELIHGEHPHSRRDDNTYARDPRDGEILPFSGHTYLYSVLIDEVNYLKESEYSGDEVRKACACKLFVNGFPFYEIRARDAQSALRRAAAFLEGFGEGPEGYYLEAVASGKPNALIGRRIYYRETPAVIRSVIPDQGCIVVIPDGVDQFPLSASDIESLKGDDDDFDEEDLTSVKVEVDSKSLWWWRKDETEEELETLAANIKASSQGVMMDVNNPVPSRLPVTANTTQEETREKA